MKLRVNRRGRGQLSVVRYASGAAVEFGATDDGQEKANRGRRRTCVRKVAIVASLNVLPARIVPCAPLKVSYSLNSRGVAFNGWWIFFSHEIFS